MADDGKYVLDEIDQKTLNELDQLLLTEDVLQYKSWDHFRRATGYPESFLSPSTARRPAGPIYAPIQTPIESDAAQSARDAVKTSGFLAELEREVAQLHQGTSTQQDQLRRSQQLHEALSRIFSFLHQMSHHANELQPEISRYYRLDSQAAYTKLRWQGAFTDSRKQDSSDKSFLSHVSFRVRLVAAQPLTLTRRWHQLEVLKRDLHTLNLRALDDSVFDVKTEQELIEVQLAPDFPVQISLKGNYKEHRIDVLSRNLEGFYISAFILEIEQVNQALLDGLGRFLLSRVDVLPEAFQRINYIPQTETIYRTY